MDRWTRRKSRTKGLSWQAMTVIVTVMVGVYFVMPLGQHDDPLPLAVATAISLATAAILALVMARHIKRVLLDPSSEGIPTLVILFVIVVLAFAAGFFLLDRSDPGQVEGLRTRLDSLYFTLTTMGTVGYGDVHPAGQAARSLACAQLVINGVFVAGLARTIMYQFRSVRGLERTD